MIVKMISDINTELHQGLGRVEGKLDILIASQSSLADKVDGLTSGQSKHGERLTALETRNTQLHVFLGFAFAIIAAVTAIWADVKGFFHL